MAQWIYDEFWADKDEYTADDLAELFALATKHDQIPLSLVAWVDQQPVGTISLIENDDSDRPHLRPWLAALYVDPPFRRIGVGSRLVNGLKQRAASMGIEAMFLGTDQPEFYQPFGATIIDRYRQTMCVMRMPTSPA